MKICTAICLFYTIAATVTHALPKPADKDLEESYGITDDENVQNDNTKQDFNDYDDEEVDTNEQTESKLEILNQGQEFINNLGDTVLLPCQIQGTGPVQIWRKDQKILFQDKITLSARENMRILANGTLEIDKLEMDNAGVYECEAMYDEKSKLSIQHVVRLNSPPIVEKVMVKGGSTVLKVGDTLELECVAHGTPTPHISWHKNSERLGEEGSVLRIENVKHHTAGTYRCLADNKIGEPGHGKIQIKIEYKPNVAIEKITVNSDTSMSTELKCTVHGEPRPNVVWLKDHKNVVASERIQFENVESAHVLRFSALQDGDFAVYTCLARNAVGESRKELRLVKTPAVLRFLKPERGAKDAVLAWEVQSTSPIAEHELGYRRKGEEEWRVLVPEVGRRVGDVYEVKFAINGLEPGAYETRIRSRNGNGWGEYSEPMSFEGDKLIPTQEASTIKNSHDDIPPAEHSEYDKEIVAGASESSAASFSTPIFFLVSILSLFYLIRQ